MKEPGREQTTSSATTKSTRSQPVVLVTEDHEDTRLLFRTILTMRGCSVIEAEDGEQAVQVAESVSLDLILMDGSLPRLDGLAATRRIRQLRNGSNPPIVFISGSAEPSFRQKALKAGCDEFLLKPLDFKLFGRVLEKHLGTYEGRASIF